MKGEGLKLPGEVEPHELLEVVVDSVCGPSVILGEVWLWCDFIPVLREPLPSWNNTDTLLLEDCLNLP